MNISRLFLGLSCVVLWCAACGAAEEEPSEDVDTGAMCSSDNDCKGDRVCESGVCVSPEDGGSIDPPDTPPSTATCATTCDKVVGCYPDQISRDDCMANCEQNVTQTQRSCITSAATCADADQCVSSTPMPGNATPGEPVECLDAVQCMANEYCWQPEGALTGECQLNDFGQSCQSDAECAYNLCVFATSEDNFGECRRSCTVDAECPSAWTCQPPPPGANYNTSRCVRR